MAILLILLILVLGYRYTNAIPAEKIALKRSSGWEAYVRMGSHGIRFVWNAIFVYAIYSCLYCYINLFYCTNFSYI